MIDLKKYKEDGYIVIENFVKPSDLQDFELYLDNLCMQQIKKLNIKKLATDPVIDLFNRGGSIS
jgi:hypothetical protein